MTTSQCDDQLLPAEIAGFWKIYQNTQTHPRERFKAAKAAAHLAIKAFEAGEHDTQRLTRYIDIVAAGMKVHTFPQEFARARNKMISVMLSLRGLDSVATRLSKKKKITIVSGTVVLADRDTQLPVEPEFWGSTMQSGQAAICALGGDGTYPFELRLVDVPEPVLSAKEYRALQECTEEVVIHVPSGEIRCAEAGDFVRGADPKKVDFLKINVEPGQYKVAFFLKESGGLIIALAATDAPAQNNRRDLLELNA